MRTKTKMGISYYRLGYIVIAALFMYFLVSHTASLKSSIDQLKNSVRLYDLLVIVATIVTFLFAALTYYFICFKKIKYLRTVWVETGINTLNRLLPAGIGGIAGNYVYLTKCRHTKAQAGAVVSANTIIGILANLILLAILLVYFPAKHFRYSSFSPKLVIIGFLIAVAVIGTITFVPVVHRKIRHSFRLIVKNLGRYKSLKLRLSYGLLCQIGLTLAFVLALSYSLKAVHGYLPIGSVMIAYSFGIWLGAVIPAPGGVGSVEAGLVTGLLAFRVDLVQAVAAVVIFRLLSFWLPLIFGFIPLVWSYRRGYL